VDGGEASSQVFRPEIFFLGRTQGWGIVRELGGRCRRCTITTDGRVEETYNSLHFDETFAYDDGRSEEWRWAMTRGRDGRYVAAEALAGAGIVGRHDKGDYVLGFRRPLRPEGGFPTPRYLTRFTLISPSLALKSVRVSLLGLPVATMTAFHEKVAP
jgi:hypothetical protein